MGTTPVSATASVGLRSVQNGTRVQLWVHDLPTRPGAVYEVLCANKRWSAMWCINLGPPGARLERRRYPSVT